MIQEKELNIISQESRLEGKIHFEAMTRVHGVLVGDVISATGSTLILSSSSTTEGSIVADTLLISGYVKGEIRAKTKVVLCSSARVFGTIETPNLSVEFGAHFEGRCKMNAVDKKPNSDRSVSKS